MLPSRGFFAHLNCPFFKRGLCERPHCVYRHVRAVPEMYGTSDNSSTNTTVTEETTDEYLQELERINEEIETVKQQVEQGQKRLSHYQIKRATGITDSSFSKSEMAGENVSQDSYSSYSSLSKQRLKARKYVLDDSKPRTDLEYDPLSNFSSDLRSYSSSNKEHKIKNGQGSKREHRKFLQKKTDVNKLPLSQTHSPLYISSNEDDDVLIIDVPSSPDKTKRKTLRAINPVVVNEPHVYATSVSANVSGHLEGVGAAAKRLESSGPPITVDDSTWDDPLLEEENIFVKMAQRLADNERVNQVQPCHDLQNDLLFHKTSTDIKTQKTEQPVQKMTGIFSSKRASQLQSNVRTLPNTMPSQIQKETIYGHTVQEQQVQMVFVGSLCEPGDILSAANLMRTTQMLSASSEQQSEQEPSASSEQQSEQEPSASSERQSEQEPSASSEQQSEQEENNFIVIDSSSESELNYSGMELSESDPEEECYRIFMEANNEAKRNEPPPVLVGNAEVEKADIELKLHTLAGKKRVAHNAKLGEQTENRPQPQVLVPLRGPVSSRLASQPPVPSMSRKIEQRASTLTSSTKAGQALISKGQFETQRAPTAFSPVTTNQVEYVNYIPLGATVIDVGNNLHLVLPEGTFPVSGSSHQVTSVLTPTSQVNANPITIKQSNQSGVAPSQQKRTMQPVILPLAQKLVATASATRCTPTQAPAAVKPVSTKRKIKQCDAAEVPHDIRQSYVNKFTEEFLKTTSNVNKAFEKALAEERTVYNRSKNKLKYLSVAVNALKRLRNQSSGAVKDEHEVSQKTKGNVSLNLNQVKGKDDMVFYECLRGYVLTEEKLIENNFPLQHPEKLGSAVLFADDKKSTSDSLRKLCCRCGATYSVSRTGKHTRKEECTYHYGKGVKNKVPGGVETRYSCCEGVMGSPGCQVFKLHVCNSLSLDGFVSTAPKCLYENSCPGVYSLDCEMCYTIAGLELSRVTVVNSSLQIVYDTFVKPQNEVIDYNTRFSGISKDDMKEHCHTLSEVQETLLSFISAETILIGHGLETDLCVLKLLHGMVVDTSVVFPHRLGPPYKLSLNSLTADYLRKIIQESVCGHDTAEDAVACMELMLWKVKEDGKLKKNITNLGTVHP